MAETKSPQPQSPSAASQDNPLPGETPSPNISYGRQWIDDRDVAAVTAALDADFLTQGPRIEPFEIALCAATGAAHAVAVSSGTAALHLVCLALGLRPGQTGVTSPITFAASANAFLYCGADAYFSDADPASGLLNPDALDQTLSELHRNGRKPAVVIAVSYAGRVAALPELHAICQTHGCALVEDAAHSLGAGYHADGGGWRSAGCRHSEAAILSFHPVKHITTGEGGAVLTNDARLAARVRLLRSHGIERPAAPPPDEGGWYNAQVALGFNYRLTDLQAALGVSQLARLDAFVERRRVLARRYDAALVKPPFADLLRPAPADPGHSYHLYVVHFRDSGLRRRAYDFLRARGVYTQVHYIPVYRHPYYRDRYGEMSLPGAETFYAGCLSLPLFPRMSDADLERVLADLAAFCRAEGK